MITKEDLQILSEKKITKEMAESQLERFKQGFPYLTLISAANPGNGVVVLGEDEEIRAEARWHAYLANGGDVEKFVPASGAASRMFKSLFAFADGDTDEVKEGSDIDKLIKDIKKLPFYDELNRTTVRLYAKSVEEMLDLNRNREVIRAIISPEGMNYGNLPKGLLSFHKYSDNSVRTPLEEQIYEGAQTAVTGGKAKLHFTVSTAHRKLFENKIKEVLPAIESKTGVKFDISLSEQKPSTDTLAANADNTPFRDDSGKIVTRPGGHGALIENLNDIDSTVIFIKNIDNVVPDSLRESTVKYKKILAGVLIEIHDRISLYLDELAKGASEDMIEEMKQFCIKQLSLTPDKDCKDIKEWLVKHFNRPLRVCGMVRNEGEPGGGPYIAVNRDGSSSPQILESTQIDMNNPEYVAMMKEATHFNPVDLVCYVKNVEGKKFNLPEYVDHNTGFISSKSQQGRELKALELPGLWNGAMSDWTTVFVEVPASTFNPVKVVNDLLRPAHQEK